MIAGRDYTQFSIQVDTADISRATIYNHVNAVFNADEKKLKRLFFGFLRCNNMTKIAQQMGCSKQNIQTRFVKKIFKIATRIIGKDLPIANSGISALSFKKHWVLGDK
jgi:predicted regulator of amino acid metabolism with ACT domain